MGYAKARIVLSNARQPEGPAFEVDAQADPGQALLCIPPELAAEMELETVEARHILGPDGQTHECPYVGPVRLDFEGRCSFAGALAFGSGVWLGAIQMADMNLMIDPALGRLIPAPEPAPSAT